MVHDMFFLYLNTLKHDIKLKWVVEFVVFGLLGIRLKFPFMFYVGGVVLNCISLCWELNGAMVPIFEDFFD